MDRLSSRGYRESIENALTGHQIPQNILGMYVDGLIELAEVSDASGQDSSLLDECVRNVIAYYESNTMNEPERRSRVNTMIAHAISEASQAAEVATYEDAPEEDIARTFGELQRDTRRAARHNLSRTGRTGKTKPKVMQKW